MTTTTSSQTIGDTTIGKTISSGDFPSYGWAQQGWECPRCGNINAPWVAQCNCSRNKYTISWTSKPSYTGDRPEWWKDITCCHNNKASNSVTYKTDVPKTYTAETVVNDGIHTFFSF